MFETFDHTADLGLRVRAADLNTLFAEAAQALFAVIVENPDSIRPKRRFEWTIAGDDRNYLLFDWLRTLLYHFDAEHMVLTEFRVQVKPDSLTASAEGEPLDRDWHEPGHEVKAITHHGLKVEPTADGWLAEVIVDI
jgi:SHS2 domain-containing protein